MEREKDFLYKELNTLRKYNKIPEIPSFIEQGLSNRIELREYQIQAFENFITYFENDELSKNKQIHTLFHMATGSGKTVIMAGLILYLYSKGYRNFVFFVNQTNILEKTKDNFINKLSNKYLFNDEINYLGDNIKINVVDNFQGNKFENKDINICFTTTQKLHLDLFENKENAITYDDFENNKVVFISDESHHINTSTKKKTKSEEEEQNSWEYSVMKAFYSNKDNILLEFTATADLKDKNVLLKYIDKIIYNYPLKDFRESGYTKDFQNFATNSELWDRTLMALVLSEYRKYLFSDVKLNIKPVIMLKSKSKNESEKFYKEFFDKIKKLNSDEIKKLYSSNMEFLLNALDYFKRKDDSFELLINSLKNSFTENNSVIINSSSSKEKRRLKEKQLLVNSLEDKNNPIRIIFAVDMLNEGWDVLNLFDIVRLYDGKVKKKDYTIKEAQLIGRGARYCPFIVEKEQEKFKRKYDNDIENEYRILETMFFHSRNDSSYISELRQALIATGLQDENNEKREYILKDEFKETDFYQYGLIFSNTKIEKNRDNIKSIDEHLQNKSYRYTIKNLKGNVSNLFENEKENNNTNKNNEDIKIIKLKEIDYNILSGTALYFNELRFNVLKEKYPNLCSLKEFLTDDNYLGNVRIEFCFEKNLEIVGKDIHNALKRVYTDIAKHIVSIKQEYEGTKEFKPYKLKEVLKNKTISLTSVVDNGGHGESQIDSSNDDLRLDLSKENWYVFNDNYGTSEEKSFIKYFKTDIKPKLDEKNLEYYVIRNERIPNLAIYSFKDGSRFEPDYLLFIRNKKIDNTYSEYQVYAEPKGNQLLVEDSWKQEFMLKIENEHILSSDTHKIIGLPFYNNKSNELKEFEKAIDKFLSNI